VNDFWDDGDYAKKTYTDEKLTDIMIAEVERTLGYKLPAAYVQLMKERNGGIPKRTNHRTNTRTTWAEDHVAISGISGIGKTRRYSLCGEAGSKFWIEEWGYPAIGVYFADCPSAGHDMVGFDYRRCGPKGEPAVVHVDQEWDYQITPVATDFTSFINGLEDDSAFADE
jgi:hypothetical protein